MSKKETFRPLSQIAQAIAHEKSHDERYELIARELWELKFSKTNRLPPLLNGIESDRAYLADLMHATTQEIQAAIECLKEDGQITFIDPITHLPTVVEDGSFVSEQHVRSLIAEHHEKNKERIKEKIGEQQGAANCALPIEPLTKTEFANAVEFSKQRVDGDEDIDWPSCFPNVGHEALEKTLPCGKWKEHTQRASRNGLKNARIPGAGRGKYNLYLAGLWWFDFVKPPEFDLARLHRRLADNLLPEHKHLKKRLTGELG